MKNILAIVATLALLASPAFADEKEAIAKAESAARIWLALVDSGQSTGSWDAAASTFRAKIDKTVWAKVLDATRAPLGAMKTRTRKSATFTHSVPAAPDGDYVVLEFDTQFANKAAAVETITPMLDKDGSWRVAGFYIK